MNKSRLFLMLILLLGSFTLFAQVPEGISYQAAVRENGSLLASANIEVRFSILDGSAATVYQETQTTTTNDYGVFTASIGQGTVVSGTFNSIDWSSGDYDLKVEFRKDLNPFADLGTTQLLTVPYSFYSDRAATVDDLGTAGGDLSGSLPNPTVSGIQGRAVSAAAPANNQVLTYNAGTWGPAAPPMSPWNTSGSNIYYNAGDVGIGTSSPSSELDVVGTAELGTVLSRNYRSNSDMEFVIDQNNSASLTAFFEVFNGSGNHVFYVNENALARLYGDTQIDGWLSVARGNPGTRLHLNHQLRTAAVTNAGLRLQNEGSNNENWDLYVQNGTANLSLYYNGTTLRGNFDDATGAYSSVSDLRLKSDIEPYQGGLESVMKLQPKTFHYKGYEDRLKSIGFIAQEVEQVLPELVTQGGDDQDLYTVNYAGFSVIAIQAIQEQQQKIESLEKRIAELENLMKEYMER